MTSVSLKYADKLRQKTTNNSYFGFLFVCKYSSKILHFNDSKLNRYCGNEMHLELNYIIFKEEK